MTRNRRSLVFAVVCCCTAAGCAIRAPDLTVGQVEHPADHGGLTPTGSQPYHGMIQYRAKDAKAAILEPQLVSADDAIIAPGTKVIGVFLGGQARAYPLFILNNHQIVNDQIGSVPISASW